MNNQFPSINRKPLSNRSLAGFFKQSNGFAGVSSTQNLRVNLRMRFCFCSQSMAGTVLFTAALILVIIAATGIVTACAQSTSQKSFIKLQTAYVQERIPQTLAGMQLANLKGGVGGFRATYTGGEPATAIVVVSRPLMISPEKIKAIMKKRVKNGKLQVVTRDEHTLYINIPSDQSKTATLTVLIKPLGIRLKANPDGILDNTQPEALKQQLLTVFDALNLQQVAKLSRKGLPISGHITVSGSKDMSIDLTMVSPRLMSSNAQDKVVWSIHLRTADKDIQIRLFHLPIDIKPGTYKLRERPTLSEISTSEHPFDQPAAMLFIDNNDPSDDIMFQTWEEDLTGTLTIDSINNHKMSGSFQFKAKLEYGSPLTVTVKGQFKNVPILNGQ